MTVAYMARRRGGDDKTLSLMPAVDSDDDMAVILVNAPFTVTNRVARMLILSRTGVYNYRYGSFF